MKGVCIVLAISAVLMLGACAIHYPPQIKRGEVPSPSASPSVEPSPAATKVRAPFDLEFIDTMSAHHKNGIEMAKTAGTKAQHRELKTFALRIEESRQSEIAQMKSWRDQWYAGMASAENSEMPGMMDSASGIYLSKINAATGPEFDLVFINMMTLDHAGAVTMANEALIKAQHPEIKKLANQIISEQRRDLQQISKWRAAWSGKK